MSNSAPLTAKCGVYCGDCLRSRADFFASVKNLQEWLQKLNFAQYAAYRSANIPAFQDYAIFENVLTEMGKISCQTCAAGGGSPSCQIRVCAQDKGIGCWSCRDVDSCEKLATLRKNHRHFRSNHLLIEKYGLDNWSAKRGSHYQWEDEKEVKV